MALSSDLHGLGATTGGRELSGTRTAGCQGGGEGGSGGWGGTGHPARVAGRRDAAAGRGAVGGGAVVGASVEVVTGDAGTLAGGADAVVVPFGRIRTAAGECGPPRAPTAPVASVSNPITSRPTAAAAVAAHRPCTVRIVARRPAEFGSLPSTGWLRMSIWTCGETVDCARTSGSASWMRTLTPRKPLRRRSEGATAIVAPGVPSVVPAEPSGGLARLGTLDDLLRDELTQLGSLLALRTDLELVLERYQPFGARPALIVVDIDGFARINAEYGRSTADRVLVETAGRLRARVARPDSVYRTGGDEFAAVLETTPMIDAVGRAEEIQRALSEPVAVDGCVVGVSVSVALVMLGYRHRVDALLRDADVTMYRAKVEGGNRVDLYNWELDSWSTARKRDTQRLEREMEELRLENRVLAEALTVDLDTGMPNALAFEADHLQSHAWWKRSGEPYGVLRATVDGLYEQMAHFRSPAGHRELTSVAHAIQGAVRQSDRAYVVDRGEYAVLLRGGTIRHALGAARRLRAAVEGLDLPHPAGADRRLTVSVAAIESGARHPDPADVMAELERLLEQAIADGDGIVWPI